MANVIGRGVRVEIAKTYGSAKTVSAVTQDSPGVATSTSHGLTDGSAGYFSGVAGMVQLEDQAARVANSDTNDFDIDGLDTTNFPAFTSGTFVPVTAWSTLAPSTSYQLGGGDANKLNATRLIDQITQEENGLLAAQTVSIDMLAEDVPSEAAALLRSAALNQAYVVVRITLNTGAVRLFRGSPSLPGESVGQGALGTGSLSFTVKGQVMLLAA